jgi:hypothetical protein
LRCGEPVNVSFGLFFFFFEGNVSFGVAQRGGSHVAEPDPLTST